VGRDEAEAKARARARYGEDVPLRQEEDVLDTWFSSALWPFGVMGWPEETEDLKVFYPTSLLITGFDILFFWVARMIMTGLHFMGEIPFGEVYITPLIVDEKGQKMSKSRGNIIDPMEVKESHGMDALRFTLSQASSKGRSWRLSWKALDDSRNFLNKIWNMARFVIQNTRDAPTDFSISDRELAPEDRWILSRISWLAGKVRAELDRYNFHLAAEALYDFTWHDFCDWYLELSKIRLYGDDPEARHTAQAVLLEVLDRLLKLLHPFMPFITEEIWQRLGRKGTIATAPFPREEPAWRDPAAEEAFERFRALVVEIRAVRAELKVPASSEVEVVLAGNPVEVKRLLAFSSAIKRLTRAREVRPEPAYVPGPGTAKVVLGEAEAFLPLSGIVDLSAEKERIRKELEKIEQKLSSLEARLANEDFRRKAPKEVVRKTEDEVNELRNQRERLKRYLEI